MSDLMSTQTAQASSSDASAQQTSATQAQAASVGSDASASRIAQLEAQAAQFALREKQLNDENAKHRIRARETEERVLREREDFKALYEKQQPEVEQLRARANKLDEWEKAEASRIDALAKDAPSFLQRALAATNDVTVKREILEEWRASQSSSPQPQTTKQHAPVAGAPTMPAQSKPSVDVLLSEGWSLARIKSERPDVWAAEVDGTGRKKVALQF